MIDLMTWARSLEPDPRPWLVLGKGPTFARRHEFDLSGFRTMALNHVVAEQRVDVAHIIDVDVVEAVGERLFENCECLIMPRVPHVRNAPSVRRLEDFVATNRVLSRLDAAGRLVWYNASTSPAAPVPGAPVARVRYFSSEAALEILGIIGAPVVRSLGIDGGRGYSPAFQSLQGTTMLANGQPSYDLQFDQLERIASERGIDYAPLLEPIRVFIGLDESQVVAARVLEHSIRTHTRRPVRVTPLMNVEAARPKHRANRPRTGFSFSRFVIPKLCGYKGRAIYLDADMQVFSDVAELWDRPFGEHTVQVTRQDEVPAGWTDNSWFHPGPQMSVMLLDCDRLRWDVDDIVAGLDDGRYDYRQLMFDLCVVPPEQLDDTVPSSWNHLERYEPDETNLVHYTIVPTQPWKNARNPLTALWEEGFRDAVAAATVARWEVEVGIAAGHLRPELLELFDKAAPEPRDVPSHALELDALRARLADLQGGVARRARLRAETWRRRAEWARRGLLRAGVVSRVTRAVRH